MVTCVYFDLEIGWLLVLYWVEIYKEIRVNVTGALVVCCDTRCRNSLFFLSGPPQAFQMALPPLTLVFRSSDICSKSSLTLTFDFLPFTFLSC